VNQGAYNGHKKNRGRGKKDGAMFSLRYRTKHCDPKNATVSCENVKISAI